MTVRFSEVTNRAGLPRTGVTRIQLDSLFAFRCVCVCVCVCMCVRVRLNSMLYMCNAYKYMYDSNDACKCTFIETHNLHA